ncbi:hypothetical protein HYPSUDRAFT_1013410 [Hypholoma sublateritium FD-334 SS-4]|uniref:Uncharacterized protein n=1 Tax=Hypholoma sublateritium (strain FD-334 SS-4) TaxID=945553 RepID=A0A0D2M2V0_HYPSF|nr:hypothetical protein HYPSUDRAFT_1013410 [Hypholoma sublateritium FD-334 SS-4]
MVSFSLCIPPHTPLPAASCVPLGRPQCLLYSRSPVPEPDAVPASRALVNVTYSLRMPGPAFCLPRSSRRQPRRASRLLAPIRPARAATTRRPPTQLGLPSTSLSPRTPPSSLSRLSRTRLPATRTRSALFAPEYLARRILDHVRTVGAIHTVLDIFTHRPPYFLSASSTVAPPRAPRPLHRFLGSPTATRRRPPPPVLHPAVPHVRPYALLPPTPSALTTTNLRPSPSADTSPLAHAVNA